MFLEFYDYKKFETVAFALNFIFAIYILFTFSELPSVGFY
jgi:hypothetical protein